MPVANPRVGILMGSASDWPIMKGAHDLLDELGIAQEVRVLSAHRTPDDTAAYARSAIDRGLEVIIAAAGGAAHLAGILAAHTTLPLIGVPVANGPLNGFDALLATVQMPPGIPVATVGISASVNAALLAVQILAGADKSLRKKLEKYRENMRAKVAAMDENLQADL